MDPPPRDVLLRPVADLSGDAAEQPIAGWSIGPDDRAYLPLEPDPSDGRRVVLVHDGRRAERVELTGPGPWAPLAQPLPDQELLLVSPRAEGAENARVYGPDGRLRRTFWAGDGISWVSTNRAGEVWIGYVDEGVLGSGGFVEDGLVRLDRDGTWRWSYRPPPGLPTILDCYALNVTEDATWAYYYAWHTPDPVPGAPELDFALVRIGRDGQVAGWRPQVKGAFRLAVHERWALLVAGYQGEPPLDSAQRDRERSLLRVCDLEDPVLAPVATYRALFPDGAPFLAALGDRYCAARGSRLHVLGDDLVWYQLDLAELELPATTGR